MTLKYFRTGLATNIEEYVPIITPKIIANEKPFKISPPKINIDPKAKRVVIEVITVLVRLRVSQKTILREEDKN